MQAGRTSEQIKAEIERMFGFFPNFFQPVLGAPEALESLWQEELSAYVNNPLPAVFKEKLFARLSRYCANPYCLVTHSCLMRFLGQSAGEIARVLESPAPASDADIEGPLHTLAAAGSPLPVWPEPGSRLEEALLRCSEISFLNARGAAVCRVELRRLLGVVNHTHLIKFLSFVKLAHLWIEAYPEVSYQADERTMKLLAAIVRDEPRLADFFNQYPEIVRRERESREARLSVERLKIMQEIDRSILAAQSAEEIASVALRRLRYLVPSERVTVALKGPAPDEATVLATNVDGEHNVEAGTRLPIEAYGDLSNLIAEKLQRGEAYLLDALSVPDPAPAIRELRTKGRRYYFIVPLLAHGELMGSLSLGADSPGALTAEHLEIAREVADGLAIAVQQARLHEQVRQHATELEQRVAERTAELEAFSYSVSHDLRTPLLTIDGFSRMLLDDYADQLDAEGQRLLKTICSNSQNMGRLIDDLLAFSRLGRQEMRPAEIKMSELAAAVCAELTATAPERKLQLNLQPLPPARGDQSMIRQVFVNLLSNAIKFTGPKDVAVIEVGAAEEENHNVYYVKDNGVGFEMKYADKLFGVFERLHGDDEFAGTGVGLAFVQRILRRHGGRVWAEGKVGEGATVYFTLPRKGRKSC
jgi:signal transduction histidine kinase